MVTTFVLSCVGVCESVSSGSDREKGMEQICHVGVLGFDRAYLISFGLFWVLFIVTVEMSGMNPHITQLFN